MIAPDEEDERITDTPVLCPPCLGSANGAHQPRHCDLCKSVIESEEGRRGYADCIVVGCRCSFPHAGPFCVCDEESMEVQELQDGVSLSSPAEVAAAAEQASLDAPPVVVGTVWEPPPAPGIAPHLTPMETMLASLGTTLTLKKNAERRWMALSQMGFNILAEKRGELYTVSLCVFATMLKGPLTVFIHEREAPSVHWIENFYVHGASNKKEAQLLAKIHVHLNVEKLRILNPDHDPYAHDPYAGDASIGLGCKTIRILHAPGGILDPRDRQGMVDFDPSPN